MPIGIETFDSSSEEELEGKTNAEKIITFLAQNREGVHAVRDR